MDRPYWVPDDIDDIDVERPSAARRRPGILDDRNELPDRSIVRAGAGRKR
jgi:hypothetical protein